METVPRTVHASLKSFWRSFLQKASEERRLFEKRRYPKTFITFIKDLLQATSRESRPISRIRRRSLPFPVDISSRIKLQCSNERTPDFQGDFANEKLHPGSRRAVLRLCI
ncbi:hypothetical protein [Novacetimonas pomaceti]|uniref:hypothetical protein n=1 Tax=Novacetimonas pomaceti TaxID=2021998 RepID=UPI00105770D4|nr:hypothetical protein [Novacetimonas pomaceti]